MCNQNRNQNVTSPRKSGFANEVSMALRRVLFTTTAVSRARAISIGDGPYRRSNRSTERSTDVLPEPNRSYIANSKH